MENETHSKQTGFAYNVGIMVGLAFGAAVSWGVTSVYWNMRMFKNNLKEITEKRAQALTNKLYAVSYSSDNSQYQEPGHDRYMLMMGETQVSTAEDKESAFRLGSRIETTFAVHDGGAVLELNADGTKAMVKFVQNTRHGVKLFTADELQKDGMFENMSSDDKKITIACRDSIPVLKF